MAGIDLASVLSGVQTQNAALGAGASQVSDLYSQISGQADQMAAAATQSAQDKATVIQTAKQGQLDAQTATRAVAASYGGNPDDASFIMEKLSGQFLQGLNDRSQALAEVQQKQQGSILDDPIGWLSNKLTINDSINRYNSADAEVEDAQKGLDAINQLNQQTAAGQLAIAKTQSVASVAASADDQIQQGQIEASKAKLQGLLYNADGVTKVLAMGQEQLGNMMNAQNAIVASGHLALAQQGLQLQQEEFAQRTTEFQERLKQKQATDGEQAQMVNWANQGRAALGLTPLDSTKILATAKAGGQLGETANTWITIGAQSDQVGGPVIAANPGTAARFLTQTGSTIATSNPAVAPITNLLQQMQRQVYDPVNAGVLGVTKSDPTTADRAIMTTIKPVLQQMQANIKPGDASNIYQAPQLQSIASSQAVQSTPFYQKVLAPLIASNGITSADPNQLMSLANVAIGDGRLSINDASTGIASIFQAAVQINQQSKNYTRFGLPIQVGYPSEVNSQGVFGGASVVDLTNVPAVTNALTKQLSQKTRNMDTSLQYLSGGL